VEPSFAVQQGATVVCAHLGQAAPFSVSPRVRLGGRAAIAQPSPWKVDHCSPPSGPPCATASWTSGSGRVTSMGEPLVVQGGTATCQPTLVPLTVQVVQTRVRFG
jgi:hypothetical protein